MASYNIVHCVRTDNMEQAVITVTPLLSPQLEKGARLCIINAQAALTGTVSHDEGTDFKVTEESFLQMQYANNAQLRIRAMLEEAGHTCNVLGISVAVDGEGPYTPQIDRYFDEILSGCESTI